jgi:hypothetical protein
MTGIEWIEGVNSNRNNIYVDCFWYEYIYTHAVKWWITCMKMKSFARCTVPAPARQANIYLEAKDIDIIGLKYILAS